jgi:hypothetical protein
MITIGMGDGSTAELSGAAAIEASPASPARSAGPGRERGLGRFAAGNTE